MPRYRKRTTEKAQWTADDLLQAISDVKKGKSQRQAAKDHKIPFSTFQQRMKANDISDPRLGRKSVFTAEQEAEIANHLKTLASMYYGLSPVQLRKIVFEYAQHLGLDNIFNKSSRMAGKDWLEGFFKRNCCVSVREPEVMISLNSLKEVDNRILME